MQLTKSCSMLIRMKSCLALLIAILCAAPAEALEPCRIQIVDESNGWPVPLVELKTTHNVRFVSDNAGVIAFDLPELMNVETWLSVEGHGYSVKPDGFGFEGVRVLPRPGEKLTIKVRRKLPAKRLGRTTGGGLFAESQKLGEETNWTEQRILGCDSVQNAVHNGKLFWGWGDAVLPNYPLGRFHMLGATTSLQPLKSFEPPVRLRYDYFTDDRGTPRNVAEMPGSGPTWLGGYVSLPDRDGQPHLVATYSKIKAPLTEYEQGLCEWNETEGRFEKLRVLWTRTDESPKSPPAPYGHPVFWKDEAGTEWVLFGDPFPTLKCRATFESWSNPESWEILHAQSEVEPHPKQTAPEKPIKPHRGAIAWNAYRKKWVSVFTQMYGDASALGEIWYAEADAPTGPWKDAIHVVTHNKYTFYNPQLHPEFTDPESPILLFEATFTHTFSKTETPTPRNDYNQVLYRLDLDELGARFGK
ncbi:MAG TPA: hypothetical protein VLA12_17365 [Planctomycetaceae bacterium]|nr:hypothetical protein [Planctomycetaceae bacterium]